MGKNIEEKTGKANTEENRQFRILSALGITFVVAGHLGYGVFDMGGLFPYYSFHVFIFLFVSGYFYKDEAEKNIGRYIWKKCTVLLFPYFLWNLFYGILAQILHKAGFSLGESLSLKTLFLSPFLGGHQFLYNFSAWFVPALFLVEVINVLMRKVLGILHLKREWLIFICSLILGMATIQLAIGGHVWGNYKFPGRILLMFPGFQMGRIYKEKIESHDTLPNGIYFLLVIGVQVLISIFNAGLAFGVVWVIFSIQIVEYWLIWGYFVISSRLIIATSLAEVRWVADSVRPQQSSKWVLVIFREAALAFIILTNSASLPARCSAMVTLASLPLATTIHLISVSTVCFSPSSRNT